MAISACDGFLASQHLTFYYLYAKTYKVDILLYNVLENIIELAYCLSPLIGYLLTKYQLFGSSLKYYLILFGVLEGVLYCVCAKATDWNINLWVMFLLHISIKMTFISRAILVDCLCVLNHQIEKLHPKSVSSAAKSISTQFSFKFGAKLFAMGLFSVAYKPLENDCAFIRFVLGCCSRVFVCCVSGFDGRSRH